MTHINVNRIAHVIPHPRVNLLCSSLLIPFHLPLVALGPVLSRNGLSVSGGIGDAWLAAAGVDGAVVVVVVPSGHMGLQKANRQGFQQLV